MASKETLAVLGDVHGHLQLALCMLARWQRESGTRLDAVLLCGDVGTFTDYNQLDNATRRHAADNPCELEFLTQWSTTACAPWLEAIFTDGDEGLGLSCPVVMVHGNHEGFAHLQDLAPGRPPSQPVTMDGLPAVDASGFIRYLPSGWRVRTPMGHVIAGVGGMEPGQRNADYHSMAFIDETRVLALASTTEPSVADVLITHQGPAAVQDQCGSPTLDLLLDHPVARVWFHGHAVNRWDVTPAGPDGGCQVVPLEDIAFNRRGDPGIKGWARLTLGHGAPILSRDPPPFWRDYRKRHWKRTRDGRLICPDLIRFVDFRDLEP